MPKLGLHEDLICCESLGAHAFDVCHVELGVYGRCLLQIGLLTCPEMHVFDETCPVIDASWSHGPSGSSCRAWPQSVSMELQLEVLVLYEHCHQLCPRQHHLLQLECASQISAHQPMWRSRMAHCQLDWRQSRRCSQNCCAPGPSSWPARTWQPKRKTKFKKKKERPSRPRRISMVLDGQKILVASSVLDGQKFLVASSHLDGPRWPEISGCIEPS